MKTITEIKEAARRPEDFNLNHKWVVVHQETGRYLQSECSQHAAEWAARVHHEHMSSLGYPATYSVEEVSYD